MHVKRELANRKIERQLVGGDTSQPQTKLKKQLEDNRYDLNKIENVEK